MKSKYYLGWGKKGKWQRKTKQVRGRINRKREKGNGEIEDAGRSQR